MNALDKRLNDRFTGYVVRKDLVKQVSSNAAVPGFVLEYLLGQNCATDDEDAIAEGVERVKDVDYTKASPSVHLLTAVDEWNPDKQVVYLQRIRDTLEPQDIDFTWDFSETIHARHIYVDDRWDIVLDRGLDIWQKFDNNDAFALEGRMPEMRRVRQFEVTYLKVGEQ